MSLAIVTVRRIRPHLATWLAVLVSILVTATAVGALVLLSAQIGAASTRGLIAAADPAARSVAVTTSVPAGDRAEADAAVSELLGPVSEGAEVTTVATATTRGIVGQPENARALLAEVGDVDVKADLVAGAWPTRGGAPAGGDSLEVAVHEAAADALGLEVGSRIGLVDLLDRDAANREAQVVGTFLPHDPADAVWTALPIAATGTTSTEFETYGPFLLADGALDAGESGSTTVTWRVSPEIPGTSADAVAALADRVRETLEAGRAAASLDDPSAVPVLRGAQTSSDLPTILDEAAELSTRAQAALLTPVFLLLLLGGTALAVSVSLLALLREGETRLLRTRGAGTLQIARIALGEGLLLVAVAIVAGALLAPLVASFAAARAGLGSAVTATVGAGFTDALRDPTFLATSAAVGVLAVVTVVVTTVVRSRDLPRGTARPGLVRVLAGAGVDLVLVALGVLALLQLRRYLEDPTPTLDPLTAAAPGLLVAAAAVAVLRVLPLLARGVGRLTDERSLPVAWGGWQVARRLGTQAGALLLILLAVPIGVLAVSQQSTTTVAIADQSDFAAGAPLRVVPRPDAVRDPAILTRYAEVAGGPDRVLPVARETMTLGSLDRVTVLALDSTTAGTVARPRDDLVFGGTWTGLMDGLAEARPASVAGIRLPDDVTELEIAADLEMRDADVVFPPGEAPAEAGDLVVVLTDGTGRTWPVTAGDIASGRPATVSLDAGLPRPVTITALQVITSLAWYADEQGPLLRVTLESVAADGRPVSLGGLEDPVVQEGQVVLTATRDETDPPPVVLTEAVAADLEVGVGDLMTLPVRGQSLDVEVTGVVRALPTAVVPERGVVADFATLDAAALAAADGDVIVGTAPREVWLDPVDVDAAESALADDPAAAATIVSVERLEADRLSSPVHAGMRAALQLVGVAATALAALGFAATTAAVGRTRRQESAVLHALGLAPTRIRFTVLVERWVVIALAVAAGLAVGVLITYAVVPLLVGGDGHPLVPSVRAVVPWPAVVLVALATTGALVLATLVAARRLTTDLAAGLRDSAV
ncbi:FtsX-like permease family protein [Nostocoides sp. F2B08]|uniref:FtsX-like permease family protein n=1 Tax=Nostocoides sp. F2B08 TaxID=2653936 RepID=UPI00126361F7|nr:FtsX-like permease family protein [Tetrasphaera sp. F2B08]KAB7743274.1 FtsX-like permease family protein [Tetrasphaera sp. F2B08]